MTAFASRASGELGEDEWMLASLAGERLAVAEWLRGRLDEAEHAIASRAAGFRAAGEPTMAAWGGYYLGLVQRAQGRLDAAVQTYQQVLEITALPGRPALPAAGVAFVGMAEVAYQRNDLDAALHRLTEGIMLCRQVIYTPPLATGLAALAWIRQARGDPAGAMEAMADAERAGPGTAVTSLLNPVPVQRARLLLAQGQVTAAAEWVADRGLSPVDELPYSREPEYLVLARVLLAQEEPGPALALLERLRVAAAAQSRIGSIIEIRALQALAPAAVGEQDAAAETVAEALALGCPQAMSGCSPTRARPCRRCSPGWSPASGTGRPPLAPPTWVAWPRCCGPSAAAARHRRGRGAPPRPRCRAWSISSPPGSWKSWRCWPRVPPTRALPRNW